VSFYERGVVLTSKGGGNAFQSGSEPTVRNLSPFTKRAKQDAQGRYLL